MMKFTWLLFKQAGSLWVAWVKSNLFKGKKLLSKKLMGMEKNPKS
jgi:hypothetical protein